VNSVRLERSTGLAAILALHACAIAAAQESTNAVDSATQPSPGYVVFKEMFHYYNLDLNETTRARKSDVEDAMFMTMVNVGVATDLSLSFRLPTILRRREYQAGGGVDREEGIGDFTVLAKWRVYRNDSGHVDTARLALIGGLQIRTGDAPFSSDGYNPVIGLAYTQIAGRHGLNAALEWTFTTGGNDEPVYAGESLADLLRYDLAYLYRLTPREYDADTIGSLYFQLETNGYYETNGDNELFLSPGLMYEARTWAAELSIQIPTWQEIDHRAEVNYAVVAGIRLSL
jgi:hypothetical protein